MKNCIFIFAVLIFPQLSRSTDNIRDAFKDGKVRQIFSRFVFEFLDRVERAEGGADVLASGHSVMESIKSEIIPARARK